jgi:hypothetical protein
LSSRPNIVSRTGGPSDGYLNLFESFPQRFGNFAAENKLARGIIMFLEALAARAYFALRIRLSHAPL